MKPSTTRQYLNHWPFPDRDLRRGEFHNHVGRAAQLRIRCEEQIEKRRERERYALTISSWLTPILKPQRRGPPCGY